MSIAEQPITFEPIGTSAELLKALNRDHAIDSAVAIGERLGHLIVSKSKEELCAMVLEIEEDAGQALVHNLIAAHDSLKLRLQITEAALARLSVSTETARLSLDS